MAQRGSEEYQQEVEMLEEAWRHWSLLYMGVMDSNEDFMEYNDNVDPVIMYLFINDEWESVVEAMAGDIKNGTVIE